MGKSLQMVSKNVVKIINTLIADEEFCKLIKYDIDTPLSQSALTPTASKNLFLKRIFPYPHDNQNINEELTEIRVYFPECEFDNAEVNEDTKIVFDIVVHKNLFMIRDENSDMVLRPHMIAQNIVEMFKNKSIGTIGELHFKKMVTLKFDDNYQGSRLIAEMYTIGSE